MNAMIPLQQASVPSDSELRVFFFWKTTVNPEIIIDYSAPRRPSGLDESIVIQLF